MRWLSIIPFIFFLSSSCQGNKNSPDIESANRSQGNNSGLQRLYNTENIGQVPPFRKESQSQDYGVSLVIPEGWRIPTETDYRDDWEYFRDEFPVPYHIEADFNGDGRLDQAWILIRDPDDGWGLFAFINQEDKSYRTIAIMDTELMDHTAYGISIAVPGEYKTACGKGYGDCGPDELLVLTLTSPAINFFKFESYNQFYYWDKDNKALKAIAMSD